MRSFSLLVFLKILDQISKNVSSDRWVIRTVVAVLGKALSEASFTIAFLYTTELFPTVIRLVNNHNDQRPQWSSIWLWLHLPIYSFTLTSTLWFSRQNAVGYTSFLSRLGVSISPLIMLFEDVWHLLPAAIYCAVAVGSGLLTSLLPETSNTRLAEFIKDVEKPR